MSNYSCTDVHFHDNKNMIKGSITFYGLNEFEDDSLFNVLFGKTDVEIVIRGIKFIPNSIYRIFKHSDCMGNNENDYSDI